MVTPNIPVSVCVYTHTYIYISILVTSYYTTQNDGSHIYLIIIPSDINTFAKMHKDSSATDKYTI